MSQCQLTKKPPPHDQADNRQNRGAEEFDSASHKRGGVRQTSLRRQRGRGRQTSLRRRCRLFSAISRSRFLTREPRGRRRSSVIGRSGSLTQTQHAPKYRPGLPGFRVRPLKTEPSAMRRHDPGCTYCSIAAILIVAPYTAAPELLSQLLSWEERSAS